MWNIGTLVVRKYDRGIAGVHRNNNLEHRRNTGKTFDKAKYISKIHLKALCMFLKTILSDWFLLLLAPVFILPVSKSVGRTGFWNSLSFINKIWQNIVGVFFTKIINGQILVTDHWPQCTAKDKRSSTLNDRRCI